MTGPAINHGGTSPDNPIISGATIRIRLAKHGIDEKLRQAWVVSGKSVFSKITALGLESAYEITFDVTAGVHLKAGAPPERNVIRITTTKGRQARAVVWVATEPAAMVVLDGYNAADPNKPYIYSLYDPTLLV